MQQFIRERIWCCESYRINCLEFVISQKWDELKYLRDNGLSIGFANDILTDD